MPLRALVVDDEEPARHRLRSMLVQLENLEVIGEACDGEAAVSKIAATRPDLVFLDIEMPGLTGMEVAACLGPPRPRIIFCTAYDQYAIQAFEHHAADYLLKPVNRGRLVQAVDRVRRSIEEQEGPRREAAAAERAQALFFPRRPPPMRGLDYAGLCRPARHVSGDYYDFLHLGEGRLGLVLGDVSGKGMFAGLLMASLQARIQSIAPLHGAALDRLATEVNRLTCATVEDNRYVTFFYGLYDDARRHLLYINAGHLPPLVLRPATSHGGAPFTLHRLEPNGTVIGLLPDAEYRQSEFALEPGDLLCLYTDGVSEAADPAGEEFGEARLAAVLTRHAGLPAEELARAVVAEVEHFTGTTVRHDDLTLVLAKVR